MSVQPEVSPTKSPTNWIHQLRTQQSEQPPPIIARPRVRGSCCAKATTDTERGLTPGTLKAHIGDGTDAINFILVSAGCPAHLRPLIDCLVGLAGDRVDWFEASDEMVGIRARAGDGEMSRDAAKKWVQRWRKALLDWQTAKNLALIECSPGGQDSDGKHYKSRYKVNLLWLAADAVEDARTSSHWNRDPSRALELSAQAIVDETPETPAYKQRFRSPRRDDDALLKRNPQTAMTLLLQTARIMEERGEDVSKWLQGFTLQLSERVLSVHTIREDPWTNLSEVEAVESQGGEALPVEQNESSHLRSRMSGFENFSLNEAEKTHPPARINAEESVVESPREPLSDAYDALDAFAAVGASAFLVTMKNEITGQARSEKMTLKEVAWKLPDFIERNSVGEESFIMRPEGAPLIQFDDCGASERDLLEPFAFLVEETSPENYQSWLALPSGTGEEERKRVRDRLLKGALLGSPANVGAGGATRWPGSLNCKPERRCVDGSFSRVRLITAKYNRIVTVAELEQAGLLANVDDPAPSFLATGSGIVPPCDSSSLPALQKRAVDTNVHRGKGNVPSYEKCLQLVALKPNGKPNRSDADLLFAVTCFDWKLPYEEVVALLKRVSAKARARRDDYAERTAKLALSKSRTRGQC